MDDKRQFLGLIKSNINKFGFHITVVNSNLEPRYAYTIGLTRLFNFELIFAGGIYYFKDELSQIFNKIVNVLKNSQNINVIPNITVGTLGTFFLSSVDPSWNKLMTLGVFDYYQTEATNTYQIIPDSNHYTLDIPHMSNKWDMHSEPVWQWLSREWGYPVPVNSTVVTNVEAMKGKAITELVRWDIDEWEMFAGAGPDVKEKDIRVVSLSTIIGIDKSLLPAIYLDIGKGLWRTSADSEWNNWG